MSKDRFEQWAIVEIMGHQTFAGFVSEQQIGGQSFMRVDVPARGCQPGEGGTDPERPAFTKLFGAAAIYCITPVDEETARRAARSLAPNPVNVYLPPVRMLAPESQVDDDLYEGAPE